MFHESLQPQGQVLAARVILHLTLHESVKLISNFGNKYGILICMHLKLTGGGMHRSWQGAAPSLLMRKRVDCCIES
jgi:hypothetical protein